MASKMVVAVAAMNFVDSFMETDDDDDAVEMTVAVLSSVIRDDRMKTIKYYEHTVPNYLPCQFKRFFRMNPDTVEAICLYLNNCPELSETPPHGGREAIPLHKKILMVLRYMASQETLLEISDRFNVTEFSLIRCKRQVVNAMYNHLFKRFIKWPDRADLPELANRFQNLRDERFTNVIGAIDGSHIPIECPRNRPNSYYNRKQYHSVILQGVCDDRLMFMDINVGWPGRVHDAKVFKNSALFETGGYLCDRGTYHLLGDAAYPLKQWLLTPYRDNGHLTHQQRRFNDIHSAKRQVIERTFGILKKRFRRLKFINIISIKETCKTIACACILHNICVLENDMLNMVDDVPEEHHDMEILQQPVLENDVQGNLKRQQITNRL